MNMQQMMIQAQQMQRELKKAMDELAKKEFSVNKSGAVTITMIGDRSLKSVVIDEDAFDKDNIDMVEELIVMGVNELSEQIEEYYKDLQKLAYLCSL